MRYLYLLCVYVCIYAVCNGKPTHPGPCVGPDCFHGQLMHGDKEEGVDHQGEDTYLRIKGDLAAGQETIRPDTPEQLGVGQMEIDIGAQGKEDVKRGPILPIDGEVMMHGEEKPHNHNHKQETKTEEGHKVVGKKVGPGGDEYWHGILNHGDEEPGKEHHHDNEKKVPTKYDFTIEDIKAIGGMEKLLSKVDLEALIKKNAEDYSTWMKDGTRVAEDNLWDQIDKVRQRYLSFGKQEEENDEKRADRLNPMLSEWETDEILNDGKLQGEDDIVHGLEMLGNTAPLKNTHRDSNGHVTHDES